MKTTIALALAIILTGCATVRETHAPDGRKAIALNCSGTARGWDKCFIAAGDRCGSAGFDVISANSEPVSGAFVSSYGKNVSGYATSTSERTMVVSCKG